MVLTHNDLVELAAKWLRREYPVVVTEIASHAREEPDAIGFRHRETCLVECKASRADFLADKKKRAYWARLRSRPGLGARRYYLCPPGVITERDLPDKWGLLVVGPRGGVCSPWPSGRHERDVEAEAAILVSVLRRLGIKSDKGVSIRVYTHQTGNRASLHVAQEEMAL